MIGCCLSFDKGLYETAYEAEKINADTFMFYTGSPQSFFKKPIQSMKIYEGLDFLEANKKSIMNAVIHSNYISNFASPEASKLETAMRALRQEIELAKSIGVKYLICHIGNYTKGTLQSGIDNVVKCINYVLTEEDENIVLCLENAAGQGTSIGSKLEEIQDIIERIDYKQNVGLCFDTAHAFGSGYDIVNNLEEVLDEIDDRIGLNKLHVCHVNGSLVPLGSKKDRHANIGIDDYIGAEALYNFVHNKRLINKIHILETPEKDGINRFKEEIAFLKNDSLDIEMLL